MFKKIILLLLVAAMVFSFCSCSAINNKPTSDTEPEVITADNKFVGTWINADSVERKVEFEIKADGTVVYQESTEGTWVENGPDHITINMTIDDEKREMDAYFVIAGDGFVARANEENQHYLDDGEGILELEIMLTENTCIDCIKG